MMSNTTICCASCSAFIIKKHGKTTESVWRELCARNSDFAGVIPLQGYDIPELRQLELDGFIVTQEIPGYILIQLLGEKKDPFQQQYFCPQGSHHD